MPKYELTFSYDLKGEFQFLQQCGNDDSSVMCIYCNSSFSFLIFKNDKFIGSERISDMKFNHIFVNR